MGIDANLAFQLASTATAFDVRGVLCSLGVPTIRSEDALIVAALESAGITGAAASSVYTRLGFNRVESIDLSDFEGCSQVFDLNTPGVPGHLRGRFDAVYNGGTLEHIFDTRTALRNVFELLNAGGVAIHVGPANGWLEHGFYQFSPTLLLDYYVANRFDVLEAYLMQTVEDESGTVIVHRYVPDAAADPTAFSGRLLFYMTFRKTVASTWEAIPQQRYYEALYGKPADTAVSPWLRYGPPYQLRSGVRVDPKPVLRVLPTPTRGEGFEWTVHVPEMVDTSDGIGRTSSRLMLFEDGVAIGPPHASHEAIRTMGAGRYSHWDEWLRLSPTRNDDAREHVYAYAMAPHQL